MNRKLKSSGQLGGSQDGGLAIVLALVLVTVMGAALMGLSRSTLREIAISGSLSQGTKADKAADSGMDWFITWSHPDNVLANEGTGTAPGLLAGAIVGLKRLDWRNYGYPTGVTLSPNTWDHAVTIASPVGGGSSNDMVFDTTNNAVVMQNAGAGNPVIQKFDLELRFLGERGGGSAGDPSGGTNPKAKGTMDLSWQVISRGSANIPSAGVSFVQGREMIGVQSRSQD